MKRFFNEIKRANPDMSKSTKLIYLILLVLVVAELVNTLISNTEVIVIIPVLIISIVLHEIAHGYVAYLNGDDTAKKAGRLNLNPIKHIDPLGLLLPIILIFTNAAFVIGWAKPVPVSYYKLKNQRSSVFFVSIAGIVTNLLLAFLGAVLYKNLPPEVLANKYVDLGVIYLIKLNVTLAIFNLLPIPPLDGSKILTSFGSSRVKLALYKIEKYGFFILLLLLWTGSLDLLMKPAYILVYNLLNLYIKA